MELLQSAMEIYDSIDKTPTVLSLGEGLAHLPAISAEIS